VYVIKHKFSIRKLLKLVFLTIFDITL